MIGYWHDTVISVRMSVHVSVMLCFKTLAVGVGQGCPEPVSTDRVWCGSMAAKCTATTSEITLAASQSKNRLQVGNLGLTSYLLLRTLLL